MEGIIKKIMDKYTVVVEFFKNNNKKTENMRIVDFKGDKVQEGDRVRFDLAEKDTYGRVICRVINKREHS